MGTLTTQDWIIIGVVVAAAIILAAIAVNYARRRQSERLRNHFGPEYQKTVSEFGDRQQAEKELARRQEQLRSLKLRPLAPAERDRYSEEWWAIQARFVDDPARALNEADRLVTEVLKTRGYPTEDFDERIQDLSAAYPHVIENYREACEIMSRQRRGALTTEDMRRALVHYRLLFEELFKDESADAGLRRVS